VSARVTIDGTTIEVPDGTTVLQAAAQLGIETPTLCYSSRLPVAGNCRACLVEMKGSRVLQPACYRTCENGMEVRTDSPKVLAARRMVFELLLADHASPCMKSQMPEGCELERWAGKLGVTSSRFPRTTPPSEPDLSNPTIRFDAGACILCTRCIRACNDVQVNDVIGQTGRGFRTRISFDLDNPMGQSTCVSCGECVSACPTGALVEAMGVEELSRPPDKLTKSVCPYCGVGCKIVYHTRENRILRVTAEPQAVPNRGRLCVKGRFGYDFAHHKERLLHPYIRRADAAKGLELGGDLEKAFRRATWDEALSLVAKRLGETRDAHGPDAIAGFSCAKCSNEETYLFQKFMRCVFTTNNVDFCTRLCHASSVTALLAAVGSGSQSNTIDDIEDADAMIVIGSNTTENHPVIASFVKQAAKKGSTLILIDPRRIDLWKYATHHVQMRPGTDVAVLNGMCHVVIRDGLANRRFLDERCVGYAHVEKAVAPYTPDVVEKISGVPARLLVEATHAFAKAKNGAVFWGMGISQHTTGTDNSFALINLVLLCGHVGRPGTGLNPLRGQNNVQGVSDVGCLPMYYPGYQKAEDAGVIEKFERFWGRPMPRKAGLTVVEIMDHVHEGHIRAMYIMGENPFLSDPNVSKVREALTRIPFLVVQDIFPTETAEVADVLLPAAAFPEREGTYVNTDRRVAIAAKAIDPPGECRSDWEILCDLSTRMGFPMAYPDASAIFDELAKCMPIFAGLSWERIRREGNIHWPCTSPEDPGLPILYEKSFPIGKGVLTPVEFAPARELPDPAYPYVLNTGRVLEHWHTGTMTRRSKALDEISPEAFAQMHPDDLAAVGLVDGQRGRVASRRGTIELAVYGTSRVARGCVFVPFHFKEAAANLLTIDALDPTAKIPEYKFCAVKVEKA